MYPCKTCGRQVQIRSKGECGICRKKTLAKEKGRVVEEEDITSDDIQNYSHSVQSTRIEEFPKKKKNTKKRDQQKDLKPFWEFHISEIESYPYCINSGFAITSPTKANVAHILPKRDSMFPSMRTHNSNVLYLTLNQHTRFDILWESLRFDEIEEEFENALPTLLSNLAEMWEEIIERNKMYFAIEEWMQKHGWEKP